jgi:hypothetical protein
MLAFATSKEDPGAMRLAAGAGRLGSWIDKHDLQYLDGTPQAVI